MANTQLFSNRFAQLLFGRGDELDWLEREVNARDPYSPDIPIIVVGEAGIGKTALVADFFAHESRVPPLWVDCHEWAENTPDFRTALDAREITGRDRRGVTLVLDGADGVTESRVQELYSRAINYKLIRNVVVTSRVELKFPRGERVLRLERLPDSDARRWLERTVRNEQLGQESILELLRAANGHPLSLVTLTSLARSMSAAQLKAVLAGHLYNIKDLSLPERRELVAVAKPLIITANQAVIERLKKHPSDVFELSPRQYEEMIAELLDDMGYEVQLTPATRDGGKDILAYIKTPIAKLLCLVEVKKYRGDRKIGVELVRGLYGTLHDYQANSAMLVTTSTYSKDARALQQKHELQLSLKDYADVAGWIQKYGNSKLR
ncbi:MAG TPA: restriction endonuclease [Acidobacteriaceae bacterium]|jgi:hypothetical protein